MIIKRILETYMDISDPKDIFSPNRDNMIMDKLIDKFVGVCYMSCFIIKINKVIRRSYIYMKDTLGGDAYTNVMFEVDAIVYQVNEIINGCKIIKKEPNGIIHGKSDHAGIQLSIQPNMSIFKEGDIVPVIVKRVRYNVNQNAVSVLAVPFIPMIIEPIYYNLNGVLSKQQSDDLKYIIDQINIEEQKINNLNANDKKIYKFFVDLINNNLPSNVDIKNVKKININNILELKSGIVYRLENKYDDPTVYHSESKDLTFNLESISEESHSSNIGIITKTVPKINNVIDESIYIAFYSILIKYLTNLQSLQNFIIQYPTFTSVQNSKEIWKMYSMLKK